MIQKFVDEFIASKSQVREKLEKLDRYISYKDLVQLVIETVNPGKDYGGPDSANIVAIDHGEYQGTLVFVVPAVGYQPHDYWYVRIYYGSCSGCDTLEAAQDSTDRIDELYTLCLHVVQKLKAMSEDEV